MILIHPMHCMIDSFISLENKSARNLLHAHVLSDAEEVEL